MYIRAPCAFLVSAEPEEGTGFLKTRVTEGYEAPYGY